MKFATILMILSTALVMTGCRYDKAAAKSTTGAEDAIGADIQGGEVTDISEGKFEDLYTRCSDVNFAPVYFQFDSTVVPQDELGKIDEVAKHLTEKTDRVVVIEGNCDERGSNEYNMSLGENRAIIIINYLTQNGIDASRVQTRSYGEEKPAVEGHDEAAWAKNRRGEFAIFQK